MSIRAATLAVFALGVTSISAPFFALPAASDTQPSANARAVDQEQASDSQQARNAAVLEDKARASFGALSPAELRLVRSAPYRSLAWIGPSSDPDDAANDTSKAQSWGAERTIREALIRWLLSDAEASKLVHPSGVGIAGARIAQALDLSYITTELPLTIVQCYVSDGLELGYAHLATVVLRGSRTGAINADQAVIRGDLALSQGRYESVSLFRAEIDGDLDLRAARLVGDAPLSAVETKVKGDALFQDGFQTSGVLDFRLAHIDRSLSFNDAVFTGTRENGLNAERAVIDGTLYWVKIGLGAHTELDLGNARVGSLWDDRSSWPSPGNLFLVGFVYDDLTGGPSDAASRLAWLRLQPRSMWTQPQPYRRLARVLREGGSDAGASEIEIAREDALARYGDLGSVERAWKFALWATIGYGYRPLRALWWILLFVIVGAILFQWGYRARLIAPTEPEAYESFNTTGEPPPHYPPFSSFVYSLENFLPVVDLHQGAYWRPNPHHSSALSLSLFGRRAEPTRMPARLLRWYLWVHILAGWTITPLLFAGLSGLLRND
jgi:hypothetical protein